jgi:hypothetical protein
MILQEPNIANDFFSYSQLTLHSKFYQKSHAANDLKNLLKNGALTSMKLQESHIANDLI